MVLPQAFRIVVAVILMLQGVGHVMGLLPLVGKKLSETHSADSWLLNRTMGPRSTHSVGAVIWVMTIALFVLAGIGALGQ
ncbi:MAG TPA: hypothetical protein ENH32_04840, partial [Proteobacteria bacterium]|nr:hypothetical protein [Pseudomonadota bacterium]